MSERSARRERDGGDSETEAPLASIDVNMIKKEKDQAALYECKYCKETHSGHAAPERHVGNFRSCKRGVCDVETASKRNRCHGKKNHGSIYPRSKSNDENIEIDDGENSTRRESNLRDARAKHEDRMDGEKEITCHEGVECKMCNQVYSNDVNLKKHVYNVHRMARVQCHVCGKEVNKKSLDRHMKNVHSAKVARRKDRKPVPDEAKIPCSACGKKCSNSMSLQNHVKSVHEAEQCKCGQCEFRGTRKQIEKHAKKEHNDEVFQCGRCQKILKSKSTLKEHMWIHTDHRRFICDICGMRFKRTSNYHGHVKSHQEKKFQCRICENFFLRKRYLAVHEQTIHNYYREGVPPQEKGYQCEICGVKLKWKNNLLAHMRIHTGEKPYKCKICGDDFTCHGSLRTHMTKHSICLTGQDDRSNVFIQQAYLGNRSDAPSGSSAPACGV